MIKSIISSTSPRMLIKDFTPKPQTSREVQHSCSSKSIPNGKKSCSQLSHRERNESSSEKEYQVIPGVCVTCLGDCRSCLNFREGRDSLCLSCKPKESRKEAVECQSSQGMRCLHSPHLSHLVADVPRDSLSSLSFHTTCCFALFACDRLINKLVQRVGESSLTD